MIRQIFYSRAGNAIARLIVSPLKSILPDSVRFPVSGQIQIPLPVEKPLLLRVNPTCYIGKILFWDGIDGFEPDVHRVFRQLISDARTFLDIGANIGYYSLLASRYNTTVRIICFEPLPAGFKFLTSNIGLNGSSRIEAHQLAISDAVGQSSFFFSINAKYSFVDDQLTSTGSLDVEQASRSTLVKKIPVSLTSLDAFLVSNPTQNIDLIKMDTEATEHLVLDGARRTISEHRPIILCEVLPDKVEDAIMSRVTDIGYHAFQITPAGLHPVDELAHDRSGINDFLFAPPEKREKLTSLMAQKGQ